MQVSSEPADTSRLLKIVIPHAESIERRGFRAQNDRPERKRLAAGNWGNWVRCAKIDNATRMKCGARGARKLWRSDFPGRVETTGTDR